MAGFEVTLYGRIWVTPEGAQEKMRYQHTNFGANCTKPRPAIADNHLVYRFSKT
jgi:hypothetical protein